MNYFKRIAARVKAVSENNNKHKECRSIRRPARCRSLHTIHFADVDIFYTRTRDIGKARQ